jgi:hypothetical protein
MKYVLPFVLLFMLTGCMGTKEYYNAQTAYYEAQARANIAHVEATNNRQPLAKMIAPDGTVFVVNQTGALPAPIILRAKNPIVDGLKAIVTSTPLSILAGGWTAKEILKHSQGDIRASDGSTVTSTANSNNQTDFRNADGNISEDHSSADSHDSVADPVIVEKEPVVVRPEVVRPDVIQKDMVIIGDE